MKNVKVVLLVLSILVCINSALAITINVPGDQPSIQEGINVAVDGDTILVQPGTYVENINYNGKNVTVSSLFITTADTSYISTTIIDGGGNDSVITFTSGEDSTTSLIGFTIQNGFAVTDGGGIYCDSSSPTLEYLVVKNNTCSNGRGGGIHCRLNSHPYITHTKIIFNIAEYGGGGYFYSSPIIEFSEIQNNVAHSDGGGFSFYGANDCILRNVTITNNFANGNDGNGSGGGIITYSSSLTLDKVTLSDNNASDSGGGLFWNYNTSLNLVNSILWNNLPGDVFGDSGSVTYSNIQGGYTGEGNIDADPLFVDAINGDYHLSENSPCIDAGDPTSTYDPDGTIADMGAFYFDQSPYFPIADFLADITSGYTPLSVQFTDLSIIGAMGTSVDSWSWDFENDGIEDSNEQNPLWTYYERGFYNISLTVSDGIYEDTEIKEDYIELLNSQPIIQNQIIDLSFDEDTSNSTIDLNNVFDDPDLPYGDELTFSYSDNINIQIEIVNGQVSLSPNPDWFGTENIIFIATDDQNDSVSDEVTITINPINDPPILNITGTLEADEDLPSQVYDFSAYCTQTYGEVDVLTLFANNSSHIDVTITNLDVVFESNTLNWNGTEDITFYLDDNISYSIRENNQLSNERRKKNIPNLQIDNIRDIVSQIIQVTINSIDDEIVITNLSYATNTGGVWTPDDQTINEMEVLNFAITANDPDENPLEYSWQVDGEEVSIESTFDFITDENSAGDYVISLSITDNFGARDEQSFNWDVHVNDIVSSPSSLVPQITKLFSNHPNPFNPTTSIRFDIKEHKKGILSIFNIKGQLIESKQFESGQHNYLWDASKQSSGIYLYKLETESVNQTSKMLLLK
ncbi:MAG: T9SS type A sorting domain-containing protein [Candidatus Tenebribacter davisii]|nr:T9SS type A sorting domain-containing protein [Candidatus Tenebribacter davisii]